MKREAAGLDRPIADQSPLSLPCLTEAWPGLTMPARNNFNVRLEDKIFVNAIIWRRNNEGSVEREKNP
jgi:hypothetical protein